jgi:hypothetical protein
MLRTNIDAIRTAAEEVECALHADVPGREREWSVCVKDAVLNLEQALRLHRASTEGQDGMFASMNDLSSETTPTRDRQLQKFCVEHEQFMDAATAIRGDVEKAIHAFQPSDERGKDVLKAFAAPAAAASVPDFGSIRQRGAQLVETLRKHKEDETKVLQETVTTDVGVGD